MTYQEYISSTSSGAILPAPMDILNSQILQCSVFCVQCSVFPQLQRSLIGVPSRFASLTGLHFVTCSVFPQLQRSLIGVPCSVFSQRQRSLIGVPWSVFKYPAQQNNPETNWYIYHPDHLGSSSFITDAHGDPTQIPTPLLLEEKGPGDEVHWTIEQRATTDYYTPYTFSAKERDPETGYSYFGARYYDPNVSIWLSVDPLSDKYPSMSAYMYCAGNPVMLVDPDGRELWPTSTEANSLLQIYLHSFKGITNSNVDDVFGIIKKDGKIVNNIYKSNLSSSNGGMLSRKEFKRHYRDVTGSKIRGKELTKAYQLYRSIRSDVKLEIAVVNSPQSTYGQPVGGTVIFNSIEGFANPMNKNQSLTQLQDLIKGGCNADEFNHEFDKVHSDLSGENWKLFGFVDPKQGGVNTIPSHMSQHHGTLVINGNTAPENSEN